MSPDLMVIVNKNRDKNNSGVTTAVSDDINEIVVKIGQGETDEDEYLAVRLDTKPSVVVVNLYGGQESKASNDKIKERWERLKKDIKSWHESGDLVLILGDWNIQIGNDEWGVEGNHGKVSYGGKLLRQMLQDENSDMILLNNSDKAVGGPWTREDPADSSKKSVLDLAVCSRQLERYVKFLCIDSERNWAARRV